MSPHFPIPETERVLLPRALVGRPVPRSEYRFQLGELVNWCGEKWLIRGRERSWMGREIYRVYREGDERPVRHVDGNVLLSV